MNRGPAGELERILVLLLILLMIGAGLARESAAQRELRPEALPLTPRLSLVEVPDMQGRGLAEAEKILGGARLKLGQVSRTPSRSQSGTVIEQTPGAGQKVRSGTPVDLVVAIPFREERPDLTQVPNLIGRSADQVPALLKRARLRPGQQQERDSTEAAGTVIEQKPGAGQQVEIGSAVDYLVAVAPPPPRPELTAVPNLIGRSADQVPALLKRARLRPGQQQERDSTEAAGTVIEQKPGAGQQVEIGSAVDYLVAVAPPPPRPELTRVPELENQPMEEAFSRLSATRLVAGAVTEQPGDQPAGRILRQHPAGGAEVEVGSAVDLVVSVGQPEPDTLVVPELVSRSLVEARKELESAGLALGVIGERPSDREVGRVLEQSPAAGSRVVPGTAVSLVLSAAPIPGVPWGPMVGGLVATAGVGLLLLRVLRQTKASGATTAPFQIVPEPDPGMQSISRTDAAGIEWQTELRPLRDDGVQKVEAQGPLVLEEKIDDHDS